MTPKLFSETEPAATALERALQELLACPECRGELARDSETLRCAACSARFPLVEGIPVFTGEKAGSQQEEERSFRDDAAGKELRRTPRELMETAGLHHCLPVMGEHARRFRGRFSKREWILDVGAGYAWPWAGMGDGAGVIGLDFSLGNLRLARRLAGEREDLLLICADASRLPLKEGVISGLWSAQAFQHFPEPVFEKARRELDRVFKKEFRMELHHLHPAPLYRLLYRLRGKHLHRKGRAGPFETCRLTPAEWKSKWSSLRGGRLEIRSGYSELFFHPELGLRPRPYAAGLEQWIASRLPALAGLIARQGVLRVETSSR